MSSPPMLHARTAPAGVVLPSGDVLVLGGLGPDQVYLDSTELYLAKDQLWVEKAPMPGPALDVQAVALDNGDVIAVGGAESGHSLSSAWRYESAADKWVPLAPMHHARQGHVLTKLSDSRLLVVGGNDDSLKISQPEVYDIAHDVWTETTPLAKVSWRSFAVGLPTGEILVGGGQTTEDSPSGWGYGRRSQLFNPVDGSWTPVGDLPDGDFFYRAVLLPKGDVLAFSEGGHGVTVYSVRERTWGALTLLPNADNEGPLAVTLTDGRVVALGLFRWEIGEFPPEAHTAILEPDNPQWKLAPEPDQYGNGLDGFLLALPGGKAILGGGLGDGDLPTAVVKTFDCPYSL